MFSGESDDGVVRAVLFVDGQRLSEVVPFVTEDVWVEALHVLVPTNTLERPEGDWIGEAEAKEDVGDGYTLVRWSMEEGRGDEIDSMDRHGWERRTHCACP